jgi:EPS-associated MarR family transcriptional regulator
LTSKLPHRFIDDEACYRLLKLLEQHPEITQRELAGALGMSLGKANYCVRVVVESGWVEIGRTSQSSNKAVYSYQLTSRGLREKIGAARRFLDRRLAEHEAITREIETLRQEVLASENNI